MKHSILTAAALCAICGTAAAAPRLNEVLVNPASTDDNGEFVEIRSTTGGAETFTNHTLLVLEGDSSAPGVIDIAVNLNALGSGASGLLLLRDGTGAALNPAADAGTNSSTVFTAAQLENGSLTFLVVTGFSGAAGNDLDTNDDGTIDSTPWTAVVDALGNIENDGAGNFGYADDFGFTNLDENVGGFEHEGMIYDAVLSQWIGVNISGGVPGPFTVNTNQSNPFNAKYDGHVMTPGSLNVFTSVENWEAMN
ncbi:MAG: hypothetical protein SF028_11235 [Candidatus Sumerlaeia bacterium]|nr:hypothetical protein [Candidatus Sumerlaeia bacterium]